MDRKVRIEPKVRDANHREIVDAINALGDGNNGNFFYITPWHISGGIDGIRIAASGGNITGTITLYGR